MTSDAKQEADAAIPKGHRPGDRVQDPRGWGRETVESIVVAFTLALLFRAFEAEAFVIPTGSMAPTLMGRHKDLVCDACGRDFRVGCSAEEDDDSHRKRAELALLESENRDPGRIAALRRNLGDKLVSRARCPNCGNLMPLTVGPDDARRYDPRYPSFSGDRILVDKLAYDFAEPKRWDVVVFKYPEDAKTNYIKRLVGLPGENIFISAGDIWTSRGDADPAIARKPDAALVAMLQLVHDSEHVSPELRKAGWPQAWTDWTTATVDAPCRWSTADAGRSFTVACGAGGSAMLRYRHLIPSFDTWREVRQGKQVGDRAKPLLIGDFQPYNAESLGPRWVGDLALECALESRAATGTVTLDLVEAGVRHTCTIDLADGRATLAPGAAGTDGQSLDPVTGTTPIRGRGRWRLVFANVDDELRLFVDGRAVAFSGPATWSRSLPDAFETRPAVRSGRPGDADPGDLSPAGITATGADVSVSRLRILRDVYYIASGAASAMAGRTPEEEYLGFPLEAGQYFMLGDNSSASKDSRAWERLHHVDRRLIIGRAVAIFWPHAIPAAWSIPLRIGGLEVRLPSWPNFGRMGFVR
jgi:signal peptidase I